MGSDIFHEVDLYFQFRVPKLKNKRQSNGRISELFDMQPNKIKQPNL